MPDYSKLIDAETWAFIERTNSFYPADTVDHGIGEQRAIYDRMCREFHAGYPENVTAETMSIGGRIPVRIYRRAQPDNAAVVLYFHGGGCILGGLDSHDDVCAELCGSTGYEVVSVDYRLVPEHTHPAAFDDAMAAFDWASARYDRAIVLAGDSAGGNLAAAVAHFSRGHARAPAGQVLIYPGLGGDETAGSYVEHAEAPMLTTRDVQYYAGMRAAGRDVAGDVSFSPLADTDFSMLPPTVIVTAQCDPLASDAEAYRDRIVAAGGRAVWFDEQGLVHGYLRARHSVPRAAASFSRICDAVHALGQRHWHY
ncbi:alpha/beta hydrolase [Mesorhizobium microcysteis]|uniref:Alpha/beta hydrolase n=1 Tax=Neoaquamicrobium microcysteis TaxID=2682781 RepID=A0A5D4GN78_9HYPH|nr:alpha/beta hydrolase [Mesorhizobium microcysteis]TYR30286.1 alpha/beta hydrolase [Mesorhizobium microcysteis]